jgi:colanic acid biosynthesis glycosyl transferase WcaI
MKILIFGLNYAPELIGTGKYTGELGAWLSEHNHDVRVICAPPYYPDWNVSAGYRAWRYLSEVENGVKIFRCPLYVPKKPNVFLRLVHLISFSVSSMPLLFIHIFWKPDIVITIEPTMFCAPGTLLLAKLSGAKSLLHIQDFELDAMLKLEMGRHGFFTSFGYKIESWIMRRFDAISTISNSMVESARKKLNGKNNPVFYFPNWVDINFIKAGMDDSFYRQKWEISTDKKVVIYSGNLGEKQGLEIVIEAASQLSETENVVFLIIGSGAVKDRLVALARQLNLTNVIFHPIQPYQQLPALMALGDIFLVVQKKGVADAVLPSKLTTILAAGKNTLITAEKETELGILCEKNPGIAKLVIPEDIENFVCVLKDMLQEVDFNKTSINLIARKYAEDFLGKEEALGRFAENLNLLAAGNLYESNH